MLVDGVVPREDLAQLPDARWALYLIGPHAHRSGSRHFFKAHPRKSRSQGPAPGIKNRSSNNVLHLNRIEGFQLHLIPLQVSVCHQCSIGTTREDDQQRRILHYLEGVYNGFPTSVRESAFAQNQTRSMPLQVRHSIPAIRDPLVRPVLQRQDGQQCCFILTGFRYRQDWWR